MSVYALDTHALVWRLRDDPHLSPRAQNALLEIRGNQSQAVISVLCLVECVHLAERRKIPQDEYDHPQRLLTHHPWPNLTVAPVDLAVVEHYARISRDQVPDMPDRLIFATALRHGATLISKDPHASRVPGLSVLW